MRRVSLAGLLVGLLAGRAGASIIDMSIQWDGNIAIPDDDSDGAYAEIIIPINEDDPNPTVKDLNVDVIVEHPRQGDLIIRLERVFNDQTIVAVELMNRPGDGAIVGGFTAANIGDPDTNPRTNHDRFFFDDDAPSVYDAPTPQVPGTDNVTGLWQPENALSAFHFQPKWGTWRLFVIDAESGETGEIRSFSLHFAPIPEPATVALLAAGASIVLLRRRRLAA
jgi:subtilisin-like proprotein convertase family protein